MKRWLVKDSMDESKYAVIGSSRKPKDSFGEAPLDIDGSPERAEWLQVEVIDGVETVTVDQVKKDSVIAFESGRADLDEQARQQKVVRRNKIKKVLRDFKPGDENNSGEIRKVLKAMIAFIKEHNDLSEGS